MKSIQLVREERVIQMAEDIQELANRVQHLVDLLDDRGFLDMGGFTFPDGHVWYSTRRIEAALEEGA